MNELHEPIVNVPDEPKSLPTFKKKYAVKAWAASAEEPPHATCHCENEYAATAVVKSLLLASVQGAENIRITTYYVTN